MKNLKGIKLTQAKIELGYTGIDAEGATVYQVETFSPDPAWTALLMRYLRLHEAVGQRNEGASKISLQGACGEFPAVSENRWHPSQAFTG